MQPSYWLGRTILSQYGVLAEVIDVRVDTLSCRDLRINKLWDFDRDRVSLVTRAGEIVDPENREVYGRVVDGDWEMYPDEGCRVLSPEEMAREWESRPNAV